MAKARRMPPLRPPAREADSGTAEWLLANPRLAYAQNNWGIVLARQGRWTEAVQHYEEALRINPRYAEAHLNMAVALQRLGRYAEAQQHTEQARSAPLPSGG